MSVTGAINVMHSHQVSMVVACPHGYRRTGTLTSLFVGLLLFPVLVVAGQLPVPGWHDSTLFHDGIERHYRYYLPESLPDKPPLVILLHGGTQSMTKIFRKRAGATKEWPVLADEAKFILLVPNGVNQKTGDAQGNRQNWNDCRATVPGSGAGSTADDVGFIRALIGTMAKMFPIDRERIYATGASNGGLMSYRLATELGDVIAAVAAFIANQPVDNECPPPGLPVPVMIVNGTDDPMMPWSGGVVAGGGGTVLSTAVTLEYWLRHNRADRKAAQSRALPDRSKRDDSHVTRTRFPPRPGGAEVMFYEISGGGHTMPHADHVVPRILRMTLVGNQNRDFDSVRAAWAFLARHRLRKHDSP